MWSGVGVVLNKSTRNLSTLLQSNGLSLTINIILLIAIFLWIIAIIWTAKDIISRTNNSWMQIVSILLVTLLSPIFGLPLYFIIRPVYHKKDLIPRREASALNLIACSNCHTLNPRDFTCCIACGERLKTTCKECNKEYPHIYPYCPHCWAPNIE